MPTALDDILINVAAGNPAGIDACINQFRNPVQNLARRYLRQNEDAEDAVQDIFLDLWKSAHRFDPNAGSATTFVMTLARRRLIDKTRKLGRTPKASPLASPEQVVEPEGRDPLELRDELGRVTGAMDQLRTDQREVLELALVHGRSHQQIAETTGMALGTVKSHARRGLMRVRKLLGVDSEQSDGEGPRES